LGAMEIQQLFDRMSWVSQPANPVAYAPYLRASPLPGHPMKQVLLQFAKGDRSVTNPTTTALIRAGQLTDRTTLYRADLAQTSDPRGMPKNPHNFLLDGIDTAERPFALAAQRQLAPSRADRRHEGGSRGKRSPHRFLGASLGGRSCIPSAGMGPHARAWLDRGPKPDRRTTLRRGQDGAPQILCGGTCPARCRTHRDKRHGSDHRGQECHDTYSYRDVFRWRPSPQRPRCESFEAGR